MRWSDLLIWGTPLACAAITWLVLGAVPNVWCFGIFSAMVSFILVNVLHDGLERSRERAYVHSKIKAGTSEKIDLPPRIISFPFESLVTALLSFFGVLGLVFVLSATSSLDGLTGIRSVVRALCIGWGILAVLATLYTIFRLTLWLVIESGETAFTAAEALRRRKLKETIYADSNGDPLEVSDLRGDVSVGNDGEIEMGVRGKHDDGST